MREFDDLDILLHGALTNDTAAPHDAAAAQRVLRARAMPAPQPRIRRQALAALYGLLDGMLLRGADEPVYPMPLEGAFFKMFRFAC